MFVLIAAFIMKCPDSTTSLGVLLRDCVFSTIIRTLVFSTRLAT